MNSNNNLKIYNNSNNNNDNNYNSGKLKPNKNFLTNN